MCPSPGPDESGPPPPRFKSATASPLSRSAAEPFGISSPTDLEPRSESNVSESLARGFLPLPAHSASSPSDPGDSAGIFSPPEPIWQAGRLALVGNAALNCSTAGARRTASTAATVIRGQPITVTYGRRPAFSHSPTVLAENPSRRATSDGLSRSSARSGLALLPRGLPRPRLGMESEMVMAKKEKGRVTPTGRHRRRPATARD